MSWTRFLKGAAGAAVAAGWSPPARAEPGWATDAGVYLAYHFGNGAPGRFAGGLEVRRLHGELELQCGYGSRQFVGALGRVEIIGWDQVRLAVGPELMRSNFYTEVAADLSLGVRLGRDPGFHAEPGFEGAFLSLMRGRLAYAVTRQFSAGAGVRMPLSFNRGCAVEGRPLRAGAAGRCCQRRCWSMGPRIHPAPPPPGPGVPAPSGPRRPPSASWPTSCAPAARPSRWWPGRGPRPRTRSATPPSPPG
jgi:hypothetical protein